MTLDRAAQLKDRSQKFALAVISLCRTLPRTEEARIIGRQLLRSATSVGANYRAACRARSRAEFVAKIGIVVEEADETVYWLQLLQNSGVLSGETLQAVMTEAEELLAIFAASQTTLRTAPGQNE